MTAFIIYIIRWAATITLLYSLYGLFLRRETFHVLNRGILLFILAASATLPLCTFETAQPLPIAENVEQIEMTVAATTQPLADVAASPEPAATTATGMGTWLLIPFAIYFLGLAVMVLRLVRSLVTLAVLICRSERRTLYGVRVRVSGRVTTPFSFFGWIVLGRADARQDCRATLAHELAHVRLLHSLDIILAEITACMLWPVPFVWMLKRDLRDLHEYQADGKVLRMGYDKEKYHQLLVDKATAPGLQPIANAFNQSSIKKSFKMMYKKPSNRRAAIKAAYILPLVAVAVCAFSRQRITEEMPRLVGEMSQTLKDAQAVVAESVTNVEATLPEEPRQETVAQEATVYETVAETAATQTAAIVPQPKKANTPWESLDSTMSAIGARRIAEGVYVGKFKPNYTSDTVRVKMVIRKDKRGKVTATHLFEENNGPGSYTVHLFPESDKSLGYGYHISMMTCEEPTQTEFHDVSKGMQANEQRPRKANMTRNDFYRMRCDFHIERHNGETHLINYYSQQAKNGTVTLDYSNAYIEDVETGDRYMLRRVEGFDSPRVTFPAKDTQNCILQMTLIFPPLESGVRNIRFCNSPTTRTSVPGVYKLKDVQRKPKRTIK